MYGNTGKKSVHTKVVVSNQDSSAQKANSTKLESNQDNVSQNCCKCLLVNPPDSDTSLKMIYWLLCTECGNWWHAVCAKINGEDIVKFETYIISFVWDFCVLGIGYTESTTVNKQTSDPVKRKPKTMVYLIENWTNLLQLMSLNVTVHTVTQSRQRPKTVIQKNRLWL